MAQLIAALRPGSMVRQLRQALAASGSVLAVLLLWEVLGRSGVFSAFLLPGLGTVLARLASDLASGDLVTELAQTLSTAALGFAIASLCGVALGIAIVRLPLMRWFFDPLVSLGFPMPKIAFLPVFMLWFGPGFVAKTVIVAVSVVFPVIAAAAAGTESVDKTLLWSARSLGTSPRDLLWQIILPAATPQIFTGLQVGLPVALITTIVAEMLMGSDGLGGAMLQSMRFADSPGVFSGITAITVIGFVLVRGMEMTRARLLRWHAEAAAH
jgi:taurine transport system permease protein